MRTVLRPIAVYVDEPSVGDFCWVLSERGGQNAWKEMLRADAPAATYRQAMADGLLALQSLVDDLDVGPRRASRPAPAEPKGPKEDSPPGPSFFGFGPAR